MRKNGRVGDESVLVRGRYVGVGATPPALMAEDGIASMTQCILLGPLRMISILKHQRNNDFECEHKCITF